MVKTVPREEDIIFEGRTAAIILGCFTVPEGIIPSTARSRFDSPK